jgi:hypothetical protein
MAFELHIGKATDKADVVHVFGAVIVTGFDNQLGLHTKATSDRVSYGLVYRHNVWCKKGAEAQ